MVVPCVHDARFLQRVVVCVRLVPRGVQDLLGDGFFQLGILVGRAGLGEVIPLRGKHRIQQHFHAGQD